MRLRATTSLVKNLMAVHGLSVRDLAAQVGAGKTQIGGLVAGTNKDCSADVATAIEAALGVKPGTLFVKVVASLAPEQIAA